MTEASSIHTFVAPNKAKFMHVLYRNLSMQNEITYWNMLPQTALTYIKQTKEVVNRSSSLIETYNKP